MRLWIGPDGEMIDLDHEDLSHSLFVARHPERFGLAAGPFEEHLEECDRGGYVDFDYDTVILLAEMNGWVRVSRDAAAGSAAVSASDPKQARWAIRELAERYPVTSVALEIERLEGDAIRRELHILQPDQLRDFMKRGILRPAHSYLSQIQVLPLLEAREPAPTALVS